MVVFRVRSDSRAVAESLREAAAAVTRTKLEAAATRSVDLARTEAEQTYYDRPPARRSKKGRTHYRNGFRAEVREAPGGGLPMTVILRNVATHAGFLEKGTPGHTIRAGVRIPGGKDQHLGRNGVTAIDAFGSGVSTRPKRPVNHPGQKGTHIVERSLKRALREQGIRTPPLPG